MNGEKNVLKNLIERMKTAGPETTKDIKYVAVDLASLFLTLFVYLTASVMIGMIVFKIILVGGIEAVLAQMMAVTCVNSPGIPCDFNVMLAGIGLSLVVLTGAAIAIMRETLKIEKVPFQDADNNRSGGCLSYNVEMVDVLSTVQKLGGVENLNGLANWKGIPVTTMRRYVYQFQKDGYVTVHSKGKGSPLDVRLVK